MTVPAVGTASGSGWEEWDLINVEVDADGAAVLARDPVPTYVDAQPLAAVEDAVDVADVAATPLGEVYAVGRDRTTHRTGLYRYVADAAALWRVPCFDGADADQILETHLEDPQALCATADTLFVADGNGTIHAVSVHTYQHRWVAAAATTAPLALVSIDDQPIVLDGGADGEAATVSEVGPDGATVVHDDFVSAIDLAADPNGRLYVLRVPNGDPIVECLPESNGTDIKVLGAVPLSLPRCLVTVAGGSVLVGGTDPVGGRTLARYRPEADRFEPVIGVEGTWNKLARPVGDDGDLDRYGVSGGQLQILVGVRQRAPHPATRGYKGQLRHRFDTGEPGTVWHRLELERILAGTATGLSIRYRGTDIPESDASLESLPVIGDVRAGRLRRAGVTTYTDVSALTPEQLQSIVSTPSSRISTAQAKRAIAAAQHEQPEWRDLTASENDDGLLNGAVGRYLDLQVDLIGSPDTSPRLQALRATFDRESYLEYLPAIYHKDPQGKALLDRFVAAFETVFAELETTLEADTMVLDPAGTPSDALAWLGEWLGIDVEAEWPEAVSRAMITAAPALHRARGTSKGLLALVDTYLEHAMSTGNQGAAATDDGTTAGHIWRRWLLEYPDLDDIDSKAARAPYERLLDGPLSIRLLLRAPLSKMDEQAIDRLVAGATPAHVASDVVHLRDRTLLGDHTYLGVNAALADPTFAVGQAALGTDTTLDEREPNDQATINSRLDRDTRLS